MEKTGKARPRKRDLLWFAFAALLPLPWIVAHNLEGLGASPEQISVLAGLAIVGGAFLLSFATELSERDIPQSLALLVLALVSVLPEYAVDLHFAWKAGIDPSYAPFAVANMTGSNRLLIGFGWSLVALIGCRRARTKEITLDPRQTLELRFLLLATIYSFLIPLDGTISLFDGGFLFVIFALYVHQAIRGRADEVELRGPPALIDNEFDDVGRRLWALALFSFAAYAIFVSAEPFAEGLVHVGRNHGYDEFLLVQWLAPLASESPEFLIAILFAWKGRASVGIGALVSSKVNQWTLLVGAIPVAFAISSGGWQGLPLDARQTEELILTSAQSLLATILIADLRFSRNEGVLLAVLFGAQLFFPNPEVRWGFTVVYLLISLALLLGATPTRRRAFAGLLRPSGFLSGTREGR
jgi:cation:H+ antiporter